MITNDSKWKQKSDAQLTTKYSFCYKKSSYKNLKKHRYIFKWNVLILWIAGRIHPWHPLWQVSSPAFWRPTHIRSCTVSKCERQHLLEKRIMISSSESQPGGGRLRQESAWCFHYSKVMMVIKDKNGECYYVDND